MPTSRPNPRLAKIHRNYTTDEVARLYGVHRNTVRAWIKAGLPTIDDRRPLLLLGRDLAAFLQARRAVHKRKCGPGEIYCVRCREPRRPAGGVVRYSPLTATLGNLVGRCACCGAGQYRRVSLPKLAQVLGTLRLTAPLAESHIDESPTPSVNSDSKQDAHHHAKASL